MERIAAAGGWIDFADYMDLVLYAPGLGYYSAGATKLGAAGDFVTAPEISPLFGRCLPNACTPWLRANPGACILEVGAGTGALAAELLSALARNGSPVQRYFVLEVSADLRERQKATLDGLAPGLRSTVRWLDTLPTSPLRAIVIANEVADALPVSRFAVRRGEVMAQGVALVDGALAWAERPAMPAMRAMVTAIEADLGVRLPEGYSISTSARRCSRTTSRRRARRSSPRAGIAARRSGWALRTTWQRPITGDAFARCCAGCRRTVRRRSSASPPAPRS